MKTLNIIAQTIRQDKRTHVERITDYLCGLQTEDIETIVLMFNNRNSTRKLKVDKNNDY